MAERKIIHATFVVLNKKGVLLKGKSGSGKSDIALRLIENKGAELVADDAVEMFVHSGKLWGKAPDNLKGMLEVRGIGIVKYPYMADAAVDMVVELKNKPEEIERMPIKQQEIILGLEINKIDLYAKESSAPDKIVAALHNIEQNPID